MCAARNPNHERSDTHLKPITESRAIISLGSNPVGTPWYLLRGEHGGVGGESGERGGREHDGRRRTEPDEEVVRRDGLECPSRRTTPPSRGEQSERTCLKHRDSHDVLSSGSGDLDAEYKDEIGREDRRRLSRCPTFCAAVSRLLLQLSCAPRMMSLESVSKHQPNFSADICGRRATITDCVEPPGARLWLVVPSSNHESRGLCLPRRFPTLPQSMPLMWGGGTGHMYYRCVNKSYSDHPNDPPTPAQESELLCHPPVSSRCCIKKHVHFPMCTALLLLFIPHMFINTLL